MSVLQIYTSSLIHFDLISEWTTKRQYLIALILTYHLDMAVHINLELCITKVQSGQVNPKYYLHSQATKLCGYVYSM